MSDIVTLNGYKIKDEKAIRSYDTVASMKADTKLKEGYHVKTKGYYETNDGGNSEYFIVDDETLVDDGGSIHVLNNGLRAILILKEITPEYFGAYGDETHDDTVAIQKAIDYANTNENYVVHFRKKYLTSSPITLYEKIILKGDNTELNSFNKVSYIKNETTDLFELDITQSTTNPLIYNIIGLNILGMSFRGNGNNKLFSNSATTENRIRLNWGTIQNCYMINLESIFNLCYFTGFQIRNISVNAKYIGDFGMSDCNFTNWMVNSTGYDLNPSSSNPQITIDSGYVSSIENLYLTGDTTDIDKGNSVGMLLKNCRNLTLKNIVYDYFPGSGLFLESSNSYPCRECILEGLVFRGCSTSSLPTHKNALILNGNNITARDISFASPHLAGFNPTSNAINIFSGYANNINLENIIKTDEWSYNFDSLDRCTILNSSQLGYSKITNNSSIKRIYSGWTSDSPITLTPNQELTFTRTALSNLLSIYSISANNLPNGVVITEISQDTQITIKVKNISDETVVLNNQTTFYISYLHY